MYKQEGKIEYLESAHENFQLLDYLVGLMRSEYVADASKLSLASKVKSDCENAIETALELYELNQSDSAFNDAFAYMETLKGMILDEQVRETNADNALPDWMQKREKGLQPAGELLRNASGTESKG